MDVGYSEAIQKRGLWEMKNEWPSGQQFGSDPNSDFFFAGRGTLSGVLCSWVNLYPEERQLRLSLLSFSTQKSPSPARHHL
jgi:hypothetical protein